MLRQFARRVETEPCAELREFLTRQHSFAQWQLRDAFVFQDEIPRTSVGEFLKSKLREQFADWMWEP